MGGNTPLPPSISRLLTNQLPGDRIQTYLSQYGCPPYIRRVAGKVLHETFDPSTRLYHVVFVAKHAPSSRRQREEQDSSRKSKVVGSSLWCTDIRIHQTVYPLGCHVQTSYTEGIRVDVRQDGTGMRIFTEREELDGEAIKLMIEPVHEDEGRKDPVYTWNNIVLLDMKPVLERPKRTTVFFDPTGLLYDDQEEEKQKETNLVKGNLNDGFYGEKNLIFYVNRNKSAEEYS